LIAPCTTTIRGLPSEVVLESVSVSLLVERIGVLNSARTGEICTALALATDCK
jgi:mRNA interferase MazF